VAALWSSLWSLIGGPDDQKVGGASATYGHGFGAFLAVLALLALAGAAAGGPLVPALQQPLLPERAPAPPQPVMPQQQGYQPYPQQGQQPGPQAGPYGYPGGEGFQAAQVPAGYGQPQPAQGQQPGGYGFPGDASAQEQTALLSPITDAAPAPGLGMTTPLTAPAAAAPFQPFWFAVPAVRQLMAKDHPMGPPVGELVPGTWYLAVDQQGAALVAQLPDGSHGLLTDASGIQRG
jgi:hypothetical protein